MKKTLYRILIASLLLCGVAGARQDCVPSCSWKTLDGQKQHLGLSEERVGAMLEQCRRSGLSAEEADALLAPVYAARDEALPVGTVFAKIEEGLAKKVAVDRVVAAAELRLDYLHRAARLVAVLGRGEEHGGDRRLVARTAMALESGLPEEVLQEIFSRHSGHRYGRLVHVLEAGETLQLAGLDSKHTQQVMMDCLDRDLNRMEIRRVVDYVLAEKQKGRDFQAIRDDLWVPSE
ncbi:MAG: hypothetical protein ABFR33_04390 [Verrucomicrobiota bacterium]